jgi:uncharacterized protein (DUF305 family)
MRKQFVLGLAVMSLVLLVVGAASADGPVDGRNGRAEVRFLEGMIDHHQMALDMAQDCLQKASSDALVTLCHNVINAQSAEIETMRGWLRDWYSIDYTPVSMMGAMDAEAPAMDHGGHGGHGASEELFTDPAMMMGMMAGFNRLEGRDYEIAWLESMIDHHDDALHMAQRILERAEHAELRTLAETIIADQTAEIELMEGMLSE